MDDNNTVFGLTGYISIACERRGFLTGLQQVAHLMKELFERMFNKRKTLFRDLR